MSPERPAPYLAAVVQLRSTDDAQRSTRAAERWIEAAAARGARLVATPENTPWLGPLERKAEIAEPLDGPTARRFAALARRLGIHLLLGSMAEQGPPPAPGEAPRSYNTSLLFGPDGKRLAVYRKIHRFDIDLSPDLRFQESTFVRSGSELVTAGTPLGRLGLSICYDLRFGELYRGLVARGAELLAVPSAFTAPTGRAHWEPLLRARAIESQFWLLAPAQAGRHDAAGARHSHGHSMIVDPWGEVVCELDGTEPGFALAEIDLARLDALRAAMPLEEHRRRRGWRPTRS